MPPTDRTPRPVEVRALEPYRGCEKLRMPEISRFYGIVIRMYFRDHRPPHFHAEWQATDRRYLSEDSMSQLYPQRDTIATAELTAGH